MAGGLPRSVLFRDAKNQTSSVRFYVPGPAGTDAAGHLDALEALFAACTNAATWTEDDEAFAPVPGASAVYENVEDKGVLVMQTSTGSIHRYSIPAPKAALFLADDETMDFTNGAVTALVGGLIAHACSRDGVALVSAVGGYRARTRTKRKFNIRTRNPILTGQGL
jgi:hypothetical protein